MSATTKRLNVQAQHTGIPKTALRRLCFRAGLEALERGELVIRPIPQGPKEKGGKNQ